MKIRRLLIVAALIFSPQVNVSADESMPVSEFECRWTDGPMTLDGVAGEPAWEKAQLIENFYLPWLKDKARPSKTATKARLLWDREFLYFFAEMTDTDLFADQTQNDESIWLNDAFELFFKPTEKHTGFFEFEVNPANAHLDMFMPSRGAGGFARFKRDADFGWETKVILNGTLNNWQDSDTGWSVEGKIPWNDFLRSGGRPVDGETWKFALCRYDYSVGFDQTELSTNAPMSSKPAPNFHTYEDYAPLKFIGPNPRHAVKPHAIPKLTPLTSSKVFGSPDPRPPYRLKRVYPKLNLTFPVCVENEPGTKRFLILDQSRPYGPTRLLRTSEDPEVGEPQTLLDFELAYSLAFHPRFTENGYFYVGGVEGPQGERKSLITRYTIGRTPPYAFDPNSVKRILEWESNGHNGAAMTFGLDGMFYVTSGDGTGDSDTNLAGQRLDSLLSKVLRIDLDRPDNGRAYSVPNDNPFVDVKDARPETWAYGLRNPWRITTDPKTGHIWVGNNGQDLWEQAYLLQRGANYGWSAFEGSHSFNANRELGPTPHVLPTVEHSHAESRSLTGGVVYYGQLLPELRGAYVYGDHSTGKIWGVHNDGTKILWQKELADTTANITAFAMDHNGELLIVDHRGQGEGGLYTLEQDPPATEPSDFPRTLSASGLFASVAEHRMAEGAIPYSVISPLWSDGSHKERFLAIPFDAHDDKNHGPYIEFTSSRGWRFPDRTVVVKSFALDMEEGNPKSRRWVETRFLTKQEGEWVGYSYRWNDEQTDAVLVNRDGQDQSFTIRTDEGSREQSWHYPSRAECMVCHTRAAGFVLGLSSLQMNRDHDYGGVVDNQLCVFEQLGLFRIHWQTEATQSLRSKLKAEKIPNNEIDNHVRSFLLNKDPMDFPASTLLMHPPESMKRLVDPYDTMQKLDDRARAYLHANCAHCHIGAGGGNSQIDLEFLTSRIKTGIFDSQPQHHTFGIADARIIATNAPERSVLLHRMAIRDKGQMPQLATTLVDRPALQLLQEWIQQMPLMEETSIK